jgi:hypothetical protein
VQLRIAEGAVRVARACVGTALGFTAEGLFRSIRKQLSGQDGASASAAAGRSDDDRRWVEAALAALTRRLPGSHPSEAAAA